MTQPTMEEVAGWLRQAGKNDIRYTAQPDGEPSQLGIEGKTVWEERAAQVEARGWRPIEEAPKDGTSILVYSWHGQYVVSWDTDELWWYVDGNKHGPYTLRGDAPTHFMLLPQPPVKK